MLHVNTADASGGAARSAYKVHSGLRALGVRSRMLVRTRVTDDPDVDWLDGGRPLRRLFERLLRELADPMGMQYLYYPSASALAEHPWFRGCDVVQLYNLHGGYFSFRVLPRLSRHRPLVWRLSDMWALTGHCSYAHDCERWRTGCGSCPRLDEYPPLWFDTTALLFRAKRAVYARTRLTVVVTNRWMERLAAESPLLAGFPRRRIPNGVAVDVFRPRPRAEARRALGLPEAEPLVLFIAQVARPGTRKGGEQVAPVLARVAEAGKRFWLLVVGEGAEAWPDAAEYRTARIGYTTADERLALAYAAADLVLQPALVENLPNTVLEAMACGTPAVAFDTGGTSDAVRHLETGWLAPPGDPTGLAEGVGRLLDDATLRARLAERCAAVARAEYTLERQAAAFRSLYEEIVAERRALAPSAGGRRT